MGKDPVKKKLDSLTQKDKRPSWVDKIVAPRLRFFGPRAKKWLPEIEGAKVELYEKWSKRFDRSPVEIVSFQDGPITELIYFSVKKDETQRLNVGFHAKLRKPLFFDSFARENSITINKKAVYLYGYGGHHVTVSGIPKLWTSLQVNGEKIIGVTVFDSRYLKSWNGRKFFPLKAKAWKTWHADEHLKVLKKLPEAARYVSLEDAEARYIELFGPPCETQPTFTSRYVQWYKLLKPVGEKKYA
ncbi:MAG: hypothetical protein P1V97_14030 [Planctomycetota bacterium]|nr:hypothetical protein [Planctomycetota bacterium]